MAGEREILDADEAVRTGEEFILDRMRGAKILSSEVKLAEVKDDLLYRVEGNLSVSGQRGMLGPLLSRPTKYGFRVEIDALRGTILNWEVN